MFGSTLPPAVKAAVEQELGFTISTTSRVGGGCINETARLQTDRGDQFIKWNSASAYPGMFQAEMQGLEVLRSTDTLRVPRPVLTGEAGQHSYIILEFIEERGRKEQFWELFGSGLAALHRNTQDTFGLDHDNYIGSLPQRNDQENDWHEFWAGQRILPQVRLAFDNGQLDKATVGRFETLCQKADLFPPEKPALLHGDLWNGNFIADEQGEPVIIDPAIYYGHREMEISFTRMFGGFHDTFYSAYNEVWPLENGWQGRIALGNLYPTLVHVNLFGGSYLGSALNILDKYS